MVKSIKQCKFYHIQWLKTGKADYIETNKTLINGRVYNMKDGKQFRIIKRAYFKYTYEDINNIIVMMEDYDIGTIQNNLYKRMVKAFDSKVPAVRFTRDEREILAYTYYENSNISESDKRTLRKVLNIKE